ncbi:MAG: hypothetical protein LLG09_09500 [Negativicutes bacterium]|nr:hypothetical protein [Negativicutes bacterium]
MSFMNNPIYELLFSKQPDKYADFAAEKVVQTDRNELRPTAIETVQTFPSASPETTAMPADSVDADGKAENTLQTDEPRQTHFQLTSEQMVQGIILAEILGKPVSKRHGFRRNL